MYLWLDDDKGQLIARVPRLKPSSMALSENGQWLWFIQLDLEVSYNGGTPIAGRFIMENPINMDDLGVDPFLETTPNGYFAQLDKQNCAFMNTIQIKQAKCGCHDPTK